MELIEQQVTNIEEKKRLQELAGINSSKDNIKAEKLWKELQKEMEYFLVLLRNKNNE
jgi:hypothetical protein